MQGAQILVLESVNICHNYLLVKEAKLKDHKTKLPFSRNVWGEGGGKMERRCSNDFPEVLPSCVLVVWYLHMMYVT